MARIKYYQSILSLLMGMITLIENNCGSSSLSETTNTVMAFIQGLFYEYTY
jgi:hypothetical protein